MAGRQPDLGEGSSRESSFLDHFLRRLESNDAELAAAAAPRVAPQTQASPSNSVAALVSNYDALSPNPSNPWQYLSLSNPPSPTSQRDYYNQLSAHSSLYPSGRFQRDLAAEWMLEELEQQRAALQTHNPSVGIATQTMNHHHLPPAPSRGNLIQRRSAREEAANNPDGAISSAENEVDQQTEACEYEEAATAWYRNVGSLRGPDLAAALQGPGLYENLERMDSSGMQGSDSTSAVPQFDGRNVDTDARARWGMASQYFAASGTYREASGEIEGAFPRPSRAPPSSVVGAPGGSTRSANSAGSPNTSLSSGSGGDDSDDEECIRIDPPRSVSGAGNSSGKRKTPEPSGEEGNYSARTSSEAELKKTAASLPRKKSSFKKPREPRYAIKTRTDVDIMDDGFKWRKYGQKAVKNSSHPRNYYRCTTPQCPVRKRVERSHEDSGLVITTYEGTHTHQTPGFRSPTPSGYFEEKSPGLGAGLFHNPALSPPGFGPRMPFLPEFSLPALHQLRSLQQTARSLQGLAQHQTIAPGPRFPRSLQRESLLRAQQFFGLHDPAFGSVKQEPFHYTAQDFMALRAGASHGLPFPGRHFQPPRGTGFLDRMYTMRPQQIMRPRGGGPPPPQHVPPMSDLDYPNFPPPPTDSDLVRRVLEAEDQELSGGDGPNSNIDDIANVESSTFNHGGRPASPENFASQIQSSLRSRVELQRLRSLQRPSSQPPLRPVLLRRREAGGSSENLVAAGSSQRRQPRSEDDSLVDGLLQEMAKPRDNILNPNVSR